MYEAGINGIGIAYLRLPLGPVEGLPGGFSFDAQIYSFPDQMAAVGHTAHIGVVLAASQSAGYKAHALQLRSGPVGKLHQWALHPCRVAVAVAAAFAGEFRSGEVLDAAPPIFGVRCGSVQDLPPGQDTGDPIGDQTVFSLPPGSGISGLLSGEAINCHFAVSDLFLDRLDDFHCLCLMVMGWLLSLWAYA